MRTFLLADALILALILALFTPGDANASSQPVYETSHTVTLVSPGSMAKFRVRRSFLVEAGASIATSIYLQLPPHAIAAELRVKFDGKWHKTRLHKSRVANSRFFDLRFRQKNSKLKLRSVKGKREYPPLLFHSNTGHFTVVVPILTRDTEITFEYKIVAPTCYANDRYFVAYPSGNTAYRTGTSSPVFDSDTSSMTLGSEIPKEKKGFLQLACHVSSMRSPHIVSWDSQGSKSNDIASARWLKARVGKTNIGRLEIEIAKEIIPFPDRTKVLFLLDASISTHDTGLAYQLKLMKGYLAHVPDAKVEVLLIRRNAKRLFGTWLPATEAVVQKHLQPSLLRLENGSNLDSGMLMAAELVRQSREHVRIVAIGDRSMRWQGDRMERAVQLLPKDTIVHWLEFLPEASKTLTRESGGGKMASYAARRGGQGFEITGKITKQDDAEKLMKHLVSPQFIEGVRVGHRPNSNPLVQLPSKVGPGVGYRIMFQDSVQAGALPTKLELHGTVWSQPWSMILRNDAKLEADVATLALEDRISRALPDAVFRSIAYRTKSVSRYTSSLFWRPRVQYWPRSVRAERPPSAYAGFVIT